MEDHYLTAKRQIPYPLSHLRPIFLVQRILCSAKRWRRWHYKLSFLWMSAVQLGLIWYSVVKNQDFMMQVKFLHYFPNTIPLQTLYTINKFGKCITISKYTCCEKLHNNLPYWVIFRLVYNSFISPSNLQEPTLTDGQWEGLDVDIKCWGVNQFLFSTWVYTLWTLTIISQLKKIKENCDVSKKQWTNTPKLTELVIWPKCNTVLLAICHLLWRTIKKRTKMCYTKKFSKY